MRKWLCILILLCLYTNLSLPVYAQDMLGQISSSPHIHAPVQTVSSLVFNVEDSEKKSWAPPGPVWLLSAIMPGLGQVVMGHPTRGYFFLMGCVLAYPVGLLTGVMASLSGNSDITTHFILAATVGGSLFGITYLWNLYDANQIYLEQLLEAQKRTDTPAGQTLGYFPLWTYQGQF